MFFALLEVLFNVMLWAFGFMLFLSFVMPFVINTILIMGAFILMGLDKLGLIKVKR